MDNFCKIYKMEFILNIFCVIVVHCSFLFKYSLQLIAMVDMSVALTWVSLTLTQSLDVVVMMYFMDTSDSQQFFNHRVLRSQNGKTIMGL
jgi:hypothetical protein